MTIDVNSIKSFREGFERIENELHKVIIGQRGVISDVLTSVIVGGNVLLESLPGLGKTQLVKALSDTLDLEFKRIQFTPDLMPSDVTGTNIFIKDGDSGSFSFQKGPIFANLVLADEINRATPKTQSALLEAMQEKTVSVGKSTYLLPSPFFVLATQNPIELEGTYPLPEAQLDRFLMKIIVTFPSKAELMEIVRITTSTDTPKANTVGSAQDILRFAEIAKQIPVSKPVYEYAMDLILKGHPELPDAPAITKKYVRYGASPRGAQALISISRVYALLDGRVNVAFDDIKKASAPVLRHRLFLNFEAVSEGITPENIIEELL